MTKLPLAAALFVIPLILSSGCSSSKPAAIPKVTRSDAQTELPAGNGVAMATASAAECPHGGIIVRTFRDTNGDGVLNGDEAVLAVQPVCNGAGGVDGTNGISAGITVAAVATASCPAGGISLTTYADGNGNGVQDVGEIASSSSTVCNGRDGANGADGSNGAAGSSASLTTSLASAGQCPAGGVVYSSRAGTDAAVNMVVCNGVAGTNGSNAHFGISAVGPAVPGHPFSACHHDALYLPDSEDAARGWLIFRHQGNGANDQGIGTTGFNVWNVDIADFALVSEPGNAVTYCQAHWDPAAKKLTYTVVENSYGMAGQTGSISF